MYIYTLPRENWDETNPDKRAIRTLIEKHRREAARLKKLMKYYEGQHKILTESNRKKQAGMQSCKRHQRHGKCLFYWKSNFLQERSRYQVAHGCP